MTRITLTVLAIAALALPAGAQQPQDQTGASGDDRIARKTDQVRHSGKIVELAPGGTRFVLEEMVAWQSSEHPGIIHRSIEVTPRTAIDLIKRTDQWGPAQTSLPGWTSESINPRVLRLGDFVTVTVDDDARSRAVALQVIRPSS